MIKRLSMRFLICGIMWVGLYTVQWEGHKNQLVLPALILTGIVLLGSLLEQVINYQGDPYILPVVQAILAIGIVFVVRISPDSAVRQFWWVIIGQIIFYVVLLIIRDYRQLGKYRYLSGLLAVGLLLATLLFGFSAGGAKSWLRIAGIGIEPEEFVKLALLLFLTTYLEDNEELLRIGTVQIGKYSLPDWRTMGPFMLIAIFVLGILAAQKSLGVALLFYLLFVLMLYVVTERPIYLAIAVPIFYLQEH